jgi:outer membrane protein
MGRRTLLSLCILVAGFFAIPSVAWPDPSGSFKFALLDVERVRQNAAAVKAIRSQLGGFLEVYRVDTQKEEQEIRSAQDELARKRTILSAEGYAEERKKLEERLGEAQARVQQRRQALERVNVEAMEQVKQALEAIVAEIANERQLTLILRKDQAVYARPESEITDEVLRRLDQRLPTVQISNPGG